MALDIVGRGCKISTYALVKKNVLSHKDNALTKFMQSKPIEKYTLMEIWMLPQAFWNVAVSLMERYQPMKPQTAMGYTYQILVIRENFHT